mgnify:CR=1 FL=1
MTSFGRSHWSNDWAACRHVHPLFTGPSELSGLSNVQYNTLSTTCRAYVRERVSFQINLQQKDNVSGKIDGIVPMPCALSDLEIGSVVRVSGSC